MERLLDQNRGFIDATWEKLDNKLKTVCVRSKDKIPYTTVNGVHDDRSTNIGAWTNGFWPGLMWLMYAGTKNEDYMKTAINAEKMLDKALKDYDVLHHDVGFMWHISSGAHYKLTGDREARNRALFAAATLAARYNPRGGFIRSWNGDGKQGWVIIDCMMNIPLLYWASREKDDPRFKFVAMSHADKTMQNHVRPDGSVIHILSYDPETGEVIESFAGQGRAVGSSWSQGQSWGLYGFVLSYIHTKKTEYLDTAKRIAHYFISCVCDDYVPKSDFRAPGEPVIYDTTAGAIAACGLIEIANCVGEYEKKIYLNAALNILKALEKEHCNWSMDEDSILQNGSESYSRGVHLPIIYGDYYFAEAIYKLKGFDVLFW